MSGGTVVFVNEPVSQIGIYSRAGTVNITGGTFQFGASESVRIDALGLQINSTAALPSIAIVQPSDTDLTPIVELANDLTVIGGLSIGTDQYRQVASFSN